MADILLAFKAGRAFRQGNSNTVDPSPTKGAIVLTVDDGLLHFAWKNRTTDTTEEDLILFPGDASFVKIPSASGRVYVLKFASSDQRHFFWLQEESTARDEEFIANVQKLLDDPEAQLTWGASAGPSQPQASTSTAASSSAATAPLIPPEQLAQLQALLAGGRSAPAAPGIVLVDGYLDPRQPQPVVHVPSRADTHPLPPPPARSSSSAFTRRLAAYHQVCFSVGYAASADLSSSSPQFRAAVSNFDQALRTGLLGGLVRTLGLPEEAGLGIEPFLRAIQEQADKPTDDRMDTD
ncbi:Adhesion regulating molecule [Mycena indigotica]|uniref:Adhesion regulating molecule n=1 Tax=Mycena indigotica TaxID=2126181 RepID=A0A8H6SGY2_9AGAR|nr:Adhesion regulating molecule [Mycena indigotica]KAF7299179.1 Adhesion regulating molecule [Mycena indigotica]